MKKVIVDIDGTLTMVGDRVSCLMQNPPDWDAFYNRCGEDEPKKNVIELVNSIFHRYEIVLCSGRRESCREITIEWLRRNGVSFDSMLLRPDHDHRHDVKVKPELIENALIDLESVAFVIEDRSAMVMKWREMGLTCFQVAEGNF